MARYSEKDKDKKTPAGGTYADPPPAPAATYSAPKAAAPAGYGQTQTAHDALEAEDSGGPCSLTVVVSNEATGEPVHKAHVTVSAQGFHRTLKTNQKGKVHIPDLPPGEYQVEVTHRHGYQSEPKQEQVILTEGEGAVLPICLEPEKAALFVRAFYDAERCGDPEGQAPIKNLRFDVFDGSELLGCGKTGDDGTASLTFNHTGWVKLHLQGQVKAHGNLLTHEAGGQQLILLEVGTQSNVTLAYVSGLADLTVETVLVTGEGADETVPLPGVTLVLYPQGSGVPVGKRVTEDWAVSFSDLTAGAYTLVVTAPPSYQGQPVELVDSTEQRIAVTVGSESLTPLTLEFRIARGQVEGCVRGMGLEEGWEGIRLRLLPGSGGKALRAATDAVGRFVFADVPVGVYELELVDLKISHGNEDWVLASGCKARQRITVKAGAPTITQPFQLTVDEHSLTIQVFDPDDKPLSYAAVEVLAEDGQPVGTFSTGDTGTVTIKLNDGGLYQVRYVDDGTLFRSVEVHSDAFIELHARRGGVFSHRPGPPAGPTETTIDIPYPLITESASMGGSSWAPSGPASSADLGQTVQEALRSVLNWRSAGFNGDAKGFVAALNQSFTITQTQGHTEFTWTPRSYAAVQSGLGALTGAQASIYTRAKVALDQITPLLAGLYPLLSDADPQNVEAIRAIVRSGVTELINEFGIEGGPRVLRADDLFRQLVGGVVQTNPENVGGQLKQLSDYFGLVRTNVNTIDEEQNLTNFLIIVDYILGLQQSWLTQRSSFTRGTNSNPFLGTQLVLVERSLAVVAESVQEVYMTLDSVFVGKEERQVVELSFSEYQPGEGSSSLFVSELLSWIDQVASNEGPQLIKDGGKQGVISFKDTIGRLAFLAGKALLQEQVNTPTGANLPKGYRTARVQNALAELASHLKETSNLINPFH
jgi:Carboxypeptidase regulatory-like domain